jgi:hypothetical protein
LKCFKLAQKFCYFFSEVNAEFSVAVCKVNKPILHKKDCSPKGPSRQISFACKSYQGICLTQSWVPELFSRFRGREAKKEREKSDSAEREKNADSRFFLLPTLEARFQSPKPLGTGKSRVSS